MLFLDTQLHRPRMSMYQYFIVMGLSAIYYKAVLKLLNIQFIVVLVCRTFHLWNLKSWC